MKKRYMEPLMEAIEMEGMGGCCAPVTLTVAWKAMPAGEPSPARTSGYSGHSSASPSTTTIRVSIAHYIGYKKGVHLRHLAHLNKYATPYIYAERPLL